eukprot:4018927-Alexandrium_andersonii.AAC.1
MPRGQQSKRRQGGIVPIDVAATVADIEKLGPWTWESTMSQLHPGRYLEKNPRATDSYSLD